MAKTIIKNAYAKINLFLDVKDKRPDGYHDIESVMQTVTLCDTVSVTRNDAAGVREISVTCTYPKVPTDSRNIVHKCAVAFFEHFGIECYSIAIHIEKRIMAEAGLAGGSTDGAATLHLLNELFDVNTDVDVLCKIGVKVGADLPFCIVGGCCLVGGIGEVITPLDIPAPTYHAVVAYPKQGVSTAAAYGAIDALAYRISRSADSVVSDLKSGRTPTNMHNSFEDVVLHENEEAAMIKAKMIEFGATSAMMSGSGPSIFGLFEDEDSARRALNALTALGIRAFTCQPTV
jgi:4-diphosphocytidyl-2-C-methyl-D-erythritol kinase